MQRRRVGRSARPGRYLIDRRDTGALVGASGLTFEAPSRAQTG